MWEKDSDMNVERIGIIEEHVPISGEENIKQ